MKSSIKKHVLVYESVQKVGETTVEKHNVVQSEEDLFITTVDLKETANQVSKKRKNEKNQSEVEKKIKNS